MRAKPATVPAADTYSLLELAAAMNIDRGTVYRWAQAGMPYVTRADRSRGIPWEFDLSAVIEWRIVSAVADAATDATGVTLDEARRRDAIAGAELREMELAERRGQVVTVADVEAAVTAEYDTVRRRLRGIPGDLAPEIHAAPDAAAACALLEEALETVLAELSRDGEVSEDADDEPAPDEPRAAPEPDRNPRKRATQPRARSRSRPASDPEAAPAPDAQRVERPRKGTKPRSKRSTRKVAD